MTILKRRQVLAFMTLPALGCGASAWPSFAQAVLDGTPLRGAIDATAAGVVSNADEDQSAALQAIINEGAARDQPMFLPAGRYVASDLTLPDGARLIGVSGASRIVHGGGGALVSCAGAARVELRDIVLDGAGHGFGEDTEAALANFTECGAVLIDNCEIVDSGNMGLRLERCGGRIERTRIAKAADMGLYAVECVELLITANTVSDCGNGGILVHRWEKGADGSQVLGNRVSRIGARSGGTGEYGNGINVFRADNVMVSGNHISDCAFTAIRANSASDIIISGNTCLSCGETAIYSEFVFEGAIISDNLIDGAANGIVVANFMDGGRLSTVTGNLVRNLQLTGPYEHDGAGFGFGISVEADTVVSNNVIEKAPRYGLMLGWGPYLRDVVASGNVIRDTPVGIYVTVVEDSGSAIISANVFSAVSKAAIAGYRWNDLETEDLLATPDRYAHLTIAGNRKT